MVLYTEMVCIKHTVVQPFLQKLHLEVDVLSNCPPFSNLPFLSKVLKLTNTLKKTKKTPLSVNARKYSSVSRVMTSEVLQGSILGSVSFFLFLPPT